MATDKEQVKEYLDILHEEMDKFVQSMDIDALSAAKQLILDTMAAGGRVHVTGIGKCGHLAGYVASLLSSTGTPAYELHGTEAVHGSSGQVVPGDVVIAISNSGETSELKSTVVALKNNDAKIISVTRSATSWLAEQGDVVLVAGVEREGDSMNKPPRGSYVAELFELQCLSILLQNDFGLNPEQYVKWHPGGALGASIRDAK